MIADAAKTIWLDVESALVPIIGARGVGALYKRSVHLIGAHYPWLHGAYDDTPDEPPFAVLHAALSEQSPVSAATANGALLQTFYQVLANLIGGPLTTRLLRSALQDASTDKAVKEINQ